MQKSKNVPITFIINTSAKSVSRYAVNEGKVSQEYNA